MAAILSRSPAHPRDSRKIGPARHCFKPAAESSSRTARSWPMPCSRNSHPPGSRCAAAPRAISDGVEAIAAAYERGCGLEAKVGRGAGLQRRRMAGSRQ